MLLINYTVIALQESGWDIRAHCFPPVSHRGVDKRKVGFGMIEGERTLNG